MGNVSKKQKQLQPVFEAPSKQIIESQNKSPIFKFEGKNYTTLNFKFYRKILGCCSNSITITNLKHLSDLKCQGNCKLFFSYNMGANELPIDCTVIFELTTGSSQLFIDAEITARNQHDNNSTAFPHYSIKSLVCTSMLGIESTSTLSKLLSQFYDVLLDDSPVSGFTSPFISSIYVGTASLIQADFNSLLFEISGKFCDNQRSISLSQGLSFSPSSFTYAIGQKVTINGSATYCSLNLPIATFSRDKFGYRIVKNNEKCFKMNHFHEAMNLLNTLSLNDPSITRDFNYIHSLLIPSSSFNEETASMTNNSSSIHVLLEFTDSASTGKKLELNNVKLVIHGHEIKLGEYTIRNFSIWYSCEQFNVMLQGNVHGIIPQQGIPIEIDVTSRKAKFNTSHISLYAQDIEKLCKIAFQSENFENSISSIPKLFVSQYRWCTTGIVFTVDKMVDLKALAILPLSHPFHDETVTLHLNAHSCDLYLNIVNIPLEKLSITASTQLMRIKMQHKLGAGDYNGSRKSIRYVSHYSRSRSTLINFLSSWGCCLPRSHINLEKIQICTNCFELNLQSLALGVTASIMDEFSAENSSEVVLTVNYDVQEATLAIKKEVIQLQFARWDRDMRSKLAKIVQKENSFKDVLVICMNKE